jgi:phenylpropionate dioxygenase-like ring-hydroxylating dioxygenase large terminal subunit
VAEKYRLVWIWMGDPTLADPDLIPDLSMLDEPKWHLYVGSLDYEANYALVNDNLLDLTHIEFLHEKTLGRPVASRSGDLGRPQILGGSEAKLTDRGVRVEGWTGGPRLEILPKKVPDGDLWSRVDSVVPGINIARVRMYPQGTSRECKGLCPGPAHLPLSDTMAIHVVTPMTPHKTRYFYSMGVRMSDAERTEADAIWEIAKQAFSEDLKMIQAQQKIVSFHPGHRMLGIAADRGLVLFRNKLKKLIAEET